VLDRSGSLGPHCSRLFGMPSRGKTTQLASWPDVARAIVLDAARYYRSMKDPFPVHDVIMERALEWANKEIASREREIYDGASVRWIHRWESGKLDDELKRAIEATYQQLSRAEKILRPRRSGPKKSPRQLDAEVAHALRQR
jgi:hypothetical protein